MPAAATDLQAALALLSDVMPVHAAAGGLWLGDNQGIADARFDDHGICRAVAIVINAAGAGLLSAALRLSA
jgi:hypothetical protein